jgi:hypothetical protein
LDSSAADADVWDVTITGFIPVGTAGIGGAALYLDFAATTTLDPRITFSRTTNATVTGSNGLIQNAPHNLLTFSEQFDNAAWTKLTGGTGIAPVVTANVAMAPNGTMTADRVQLNAGSNGSSDYSLLRQASAYPIPFTRSIWVKSNTGSPQTVSLVATSSAAKITVPVEWTRVSQLQETTGALQFDISVGGTALTPATADILVWGAQLEARSTATTYNPTTVKNLLGFTENFDNAAWTKSNAFVQTNQFLYSQDFDNAAWTKSGATVTANNAIAPDGTLTADTIASASGFNQYLQQSILATAGQQITYSFYILKTAATVDGLYGGFSVEFRTASTPLAEYGATINSDSGSLIAASGWGTAGFASSSVIDAGAYWRVIAVTPAAPATTTVVRVYHGVAGYFLNGTRLGTGSSSKVLWGAQLVLGTSAGDYKATYAAAAAVGYPDIYGQPFAQKLVANTVLGKHGVLQFQSGQYTDTHTMFVKAAEYSKVAFKESSTTGWFASFDLLTGSVISSTPASNATIQAIGNGWYRIAYTVVTANQGQALDLRLLPATIGKGDPNAIDFSGDGTSGIYIFGAQLSDSASVDPYVYNPVAAPTSTAYYGPRFDYDPVTLAPKGLLIEEQRTNLVLRSEEFDNTGSWGSLGSVAIAAVANQATAPNGTLTADSLSDSVGTGTRTIVTSASVVSGTSYALSCYVKAGTNTAVQLSGSSASFGLNVWATFNLTTGVVGSVGSSASASITPVGNGWYRCVVVGSAIATSSTTAFLLVMTDSPTASRLPSYTGTNTNIFIYGAQLEAGAFATSYIPTVASQVTRAADSASMIGNNFARWYTQGPGSMFAEVQSVNGVSSRAFTVSDSTISNQIFEANDTLMNVYTGGAFQVQTGGTGIAGKVAMAYAANDFAVVKNGGSVTTDTSGSLASAYTQLNIGVNYNNTAGHLNGALKRISYYPRRLANTELQGITS